MPQDKFLSISCPNTKSWLPLCDDICLSLATALIQSRFDYSHSAPVYGTSGSNLHKLQLVQNALARTITRSISSFSPHISEVLSNLHWFPIHKRINFKVATLTYKVLSTQQPAHLHNPISYHQPSRSLRSSQPLLHVPILDVVPSPLLLSKSGTI